MFAVSHKKHPLSEQRIQNIKDTVIYSLRCLGFWSLFSLASLVPFSKAVFLANHFKKPVVTGKDADVPNTSLVFDYFVFLQVGREVNSA